MVLVTGTVVLPPLREHNDDGEPVTVILVSFTAPDKRARCGEACCEVEVLDEIADPHRENLRPGRRLSVQGELTGADGIWATAILSRWR